MDKSYGDGTRLCSKCFNIKCKCDAGNFSPSQLIKGTDIDDAYDAQHAELTQLRAELAKSQEEVEKLKIDGVIAYLRAIKRAETAEATFVLVDDSLINANLKLSKAEARVLELEERDEMLVDMLNLLDVDPENWFNGCSKLIETLEKAESRVKRLEEDRKSGREVSRITTELLRQLLEDELIPPAQDAFARSVIALKEAESRVKRLECVSAGYKANASHHQTTAQRYRAALEEILTTEEAGYIHEIAEQALKEPTRLQPGEHDPRD